jgi:hypothetical protein
MKPRRLIALAATAGIVAAGVAGCSSHKTATGTSLGASTTPATASVPPGEWQTDDLTALTGAGPADLDDVAGYVFDGSQHVLYSGATDGHLHELRWENNGWHNDDLTAATNAPPTGRPIRAYTSTVNGTQHAIWMDDFHIHQLSWDRNGKHTEDLSAAANAPLAVDSFYGFDAQGTQHVLFVGRGDSHMHDLWSDSSGWHTQDLTTAIGAPPSDLDVISGYVFRGTQHVVYTGTNERHVSDLWWDPSGWHHNDVTAAAGAPIYELWWNSTGWHMDDLRAITGAPDAGGDGPVGYAFEAQGTQHVVYIGLNDRHVHELRWGPRAPG